MGINVAVVYSDTDRFAAHVRLADEAYRLKGESSRETYLNQEAILRIAVQARVDAIHPGYGFLAENASFAEAVRSHGIVFIGPSTEIIRSMGSKTEARRLMAKAGLPLVPGSNGSLKVGTGAVGIAERIGYPVLVKASGGGGGKGMRIVKLPEELLDSMQRGASEAQSSFGDNRIYLEKYIEHPRHIELQILADEHGTVVCLGERECSIQRRHQKVIEETPSAFLTESMRQRMVESAVRAARDLGFTNAITMEFLVDRKRNFYFLEANTRLQVEHPVTEMVTGIDMIKEQVRIAQGEPLRFTQDEIIRRGHAIEARVYAEDPFEEFRPSSGRILRYRQPAGPGIRVDGGIAEGCEVSVFYDPLIAKVIAWGSDREEACLRLIGALGEFEIVGVRHNIPLLLAILGHPGFASGAIDTHFIQDHIRPDRLGAEKLLDETELEAAAVAAAGVYDAAMSRSVVGGGDPTGNTRQQRDKWIRRRLDTTT